MIAGNCGHSVTCKTSGAEIRIIGGKTAASDDYSYTTTVPLSTRVREVSKTGQIAKRFRPM